MEKANRARHGRDKAASFNGAGKARQESLGRFLARTAPAVRCFFWLADSFCRERIGLKTSARGLLFSICDFLTKYLMFRAFHELELCCNVSPLAYAAVFDCSAAPGKPIQNCDNIRGHRRRLQIKLSG
jgi:hypothetical protein